MKETLKRKNYYLDEKKIGRAKAILGAKTETEAIDAALNLVVFRKQILTSLEKVAGGLSPRQTRGLNQGSTGEMPGSWP